MHVLVCTFYRCCEHQRTHLHTRYRICICAHVCAVCSFCVGERGLGGSASLWKHLLLIVGGYFWRRRLPPTLLPARVNPSPDAVRSRNPSKSTLAHDAVNAAVSHKHHSIICVGAGLIQFVYGSHSRLAVYLILHKVLFSPRFSRAFHKPVSVNPFKHQFVKLPSKPVETRGIRPKFVKWLTRR